jgi:Zn-dependent peptidase ImmA (M78 family)
MLKRSQQKEQYSPKDHTQIVRAANDLRAKCGAASHHSPNMLLVLSQVKRYYPKFRVREVPDFQLPIVEAWIDCKNQILRLRQTISYSLQLYDNGRVRFILAHELGHLVLGHPRSHFHKTKHDFIRPKDKVFEQEADIFADEFLAPIQLLCKYQTVEDVRKTFQLPTEAAKRRLSRLNYLRHIGELERFVHPAVASNNLLPLEIDLVDVLPIE